MSGRDLQEGSGSPDRDLSGDHDSEVEQGSEDGAETSAKEDEGSSTMSAGRTNGAFGARELHERQESRNGVCSRLDASTAPEDAEVRKDVNESSHGVKMEVVATDNCARGNFREFDGRSSSPVLPHRYPRVDDVEDEDSFDGDESSDELRIVTDPAEVESPAPPTRFDSDDEAGDDISEPTTSSPNRFLSRGALSTRRSDSAVHVLAATPVSLSVDVASSPCSTLNNSNGTLSPAHSDKKKTTDSTPTKV